MPEVTSTSSRKIDHIRINLEQDVQSSITTGLEKFHFINEALPELNVAEINTSLSLFGKTLNAPILISSMTGGSPEAGRINQTLAKAAQATGVALGLGSQRAAIEDASLISTFQVRKNAPDILLFGNIGAVQLNYGYTIDHCKRAVEMIEADGLFLHLNALQEALQPEGDIHFSGLLNKIEMVCKTLPVPVIAKEVGWGISVATARRLANAGIAAIDVAGAGGTSWSQVEMHRISDQHRARIAAAFRNWGIPTANSVAEIHSSLPEIPLFASGGLRSGIDIAKCIALGATMGGMAGPFLKVANISTESTINLIHEIETEIRICMFATGCANLSELDGSKLVQRK